MDDQNNQIASLKNKDVTSRTSIATPSTEIASTASVSTKAVIGCPKGLTKRNIQREREVAIAPNNEITQNYLETKKVQNKRLETSQWMAEEINYQCV